MNACPACSHPVGPNDFACPKCGISLHQGTSTAGPAAGGHGSSVILIVGAGIAVIVVVLACLGFIGAVFFMRSARVPTATVAMPVGSAIEFEAEEVTIPADEMPAKELPKSNTTSP